MPIQEGCGKSALSQKMRLLFPAEFPEPEEEVVIKNRKAQEIQQQCYRQDTNEIDVRFSKCCNPVPGDKNCGSYITVGRKESLFTGPTAPMCWEMTDPSRIVDVEWNKFKMAVAALMAEIWGLASRGKQGLLIETLRFS